MIYLLNNSPHNEDFILKGYAVDKKGLRQLALNYYLEIYGKYPDEVNIRLRDREVNVVNDGAVCLRFNIHAIHKVEILE